MKTKLISFVIAEAGRSKKGHEAVQTQNKKSAPHYFEASVPQQFISKQEKTTLAGQEALSTLKTYQSDFLLAEVAIDGLDFFSENIMDLKKQAIGLCRDSLEKNGGREVVDFSEEYSFFLVSDYKGKPEQFFNHKAKIAGLLKSEKLNLDAKEIEHSFSSSIKYAQNDLVVVDWDGAFLFDQDGDYESTLELLELANLQLLKYRLLDRQLDGRLKKIIQLVEKSSAKTKLIFKPKEISQNFKETMLARSKSIFELQSVDRDIKLIGDWYSARIYDLVSKKFKIDEWRRAVKDKLDALENVYSVASENFTISWEQRSRIIEMVGWYVLLFGWLILLLLDIYFYKK